MAVFFISPPSASISVGGRRNWPPATLSIIKPHRARPTSHSSRSLSVTHRHTPDASVTYYSAARLRDGVLRVAELSMLQQQRRKTVTLCIVLYCLCHASDLKRAPTTGHTTLAIYLCFTHWHCRTMHLRYGAWLLVFRNWGLKGPLNSGRGWCHWSSGG